MKTLLLDAAVATFAAAANLAPVFAADPQNNLSSSATNGSPDAAASPSHYEWQFHYVGHRPRYEGHWVLVK